MTVGSYQTINWAFTQGSFVKARDRTNSSIGRIPGYFAWVKGTTFIDDASPLSRVAISFIHVESTADTMSY